MGSLKSFKIGSKTPVFFRHRMDPLPVCKQLCVNQFLTAPNALSRAESCLRRFSGWCSEMFEVEDFDQEVLYFKRVSLQYTYHPKNWVRKMIGHTSFLAKKQCIKWEKKNRSNFCSVVVLSGERRELRRVQIGD